MSNNSNDISRRSFLQRSSGAGTVAAATAFTIVRPQLVRGWAGEKLKAGLIGCGGRGTAAVGNLLEGTENTELVAMGDIFEDKLETSLRRLREGRQTAKYADRIQVAPDKRFVGFDAFKKVLASDVDIVMLCTPPGYRPMHFEAAIAAKKHVFCEKPFGTDPVGVRRFMEAAKKSQELKLTVMSGAQRHFQKEYQQTVEKIKNGAIGDVVATYAYWVGTPVIQQPKGRDPKWGDMEWQHRNWYSHVWICGDQVVEQHLHNIDVICWVMGTHPDKVVATGGAVWRPKDEIHGNIYDHISADFTFANGVQMSSYCRQFPRGLYTNVSERVVGTKGSSNCRDLGERGINPYVQEHTDMVKSIRGDGPYINHAMPVAESTLTCIMARESAYSGQMITWDQIMNSKLDLMPKEFDYKLKMDVPPLPVPGQYKFV
ncbi:MAG: Gfo/Idh/MocA family oxidoreductase [Acidobacteria bacterium]|nr:Gfo/Idh/MocA family oxidoreductase [Acidobacteriota bacterium]MBI3278992.1 Gfo/Idh/MocA family oxidoreductase [Acidobacteriota bacterium]